MRMHTAALAAALLCSAGPAQAQMVDKVSPDLIGAVLGELGVTYSMTTAAGDPRMVINTGAMAAKGMQIDFWDCDAQQNCEDMTIRAWFVTKPPATLANANAWNRDKRFTRAYIDSDNEVNLEMDLNATGGIGMENIRVMLRSYFKWVGEFANEVPKGE